jgi:hypothetical protein
MGFDGSFGKRKIVRLRVGRLGRGAVWQEVSTVFSLLGERARTGWPDVPRWKSKGDHYHGVGCDSGRPFERSIILTLSLAVSG